MEQKELEILREFFYRLDGCLSIDGPGPVKLSVIERFKSEADEEIAKIKDLCANKGQEENSHNK